MEDNIIKQSDIHFDHICISKLNTIVSDLNYLNSIHPQASDIMQTILKRCDEMVKESINDDDEAIYTTKIV